MWKEILPINCPPASAKETTIYAFRILKESTPSEEDFKPYARLYPENQRYSNLCKAYAISFYDTLENAKTAWKDALDRGNNIGNHVGKFLILEAHGRNELKPKTGHYSTWFYSSWDFQNFNPSFVTAINEN